MAARITPLRLWLLALAVAASFALLGVLLMTSGYEDGRFFLLPGAVSPVIMAAMWTARRSRGANRQ